MTEAKVDRTTAERIAMMIREGMHTFANHHGNSFSSRAINFGFSHVYLTSIHNKDEHSHSDSS